MPNLVAIRTSAEPPGFSTLASDVFSVSGQCMLKALLKGEQNPKEMAELARGRMRSKIPQLELALEDRLEEHHRFLSRIQQRRLAQLDTDLAELEQRIQEKLQPYATQQALLDKTPGVDWTLAAVIIAELGVDMSVFGSVSQAASWAGVSPAGKRKSSKTSKGNLHLKTVLVEAANAAARAKGTYLREKFFRLKARRGHKRAAMAIAHKILVAAYHMLSQQVSYHDLGDVYLDNLSKAHLTRNLLRRLQRLGYDVTIQPKAA